MTIVRWLLAAFLAVIAWPIAGVLTLLIARPILGLPPGRLGPEWDGPGIETLGFGLIVIPPMIASFVGVIAAPKVQRRAAAIAIPLMVFLLPYILGRVEITLRLLNFNALSTACSCAIVGLSFYLTWRPQRS